jgi:NhaP-type Na+/H+ or K+/H+ antiporter
MLTSIAVILLLGLLIGWIFSKHKLPSLLGMVIVGIVLSPHALNLIDESILGISGELRQIALVIILTRAGLSLDVSDLKKVGRPAVLMCFVPACVEILGTVILAPMLLGVTMLEAAIIGSVIAAVSPAVIVPRMIKLIDEGYGKEKSIPQLILAGASVDDVFVIVVQIGELHHASVFFSYQIASLCLTLFQEVQPAFAHFIGPVGVLAASHDIECLEVILTAGTAADVFCMLKHFPFNFND